LARHGRLWQAVVATLLLLVHNFELTTAQCAEWFPLSINDDESDARCGIEDVSKTSMVLAVVVACACVLLCAVPAECVMAWKSHPKCNYMYPVNLGLFGYQVFSALMCWAIYNTIKQVDGIEGWIPHFVFVISLIPLLLALVGLCIGFDLVWHKKMPDSGLSAAVMLVSPWQPLLQMYWKGNDGDMDHLDLLYVIVTHLNYFLLQFPLGLVAIYVMMAYTGWDMNLATKAGSELIAIVTFWICRFFSPPPWGPCGCLDPRAFSTAKQGKYKMLPDKDESDLKDEVAIPAAASGAEPEGKSSPAKPEPTGGCCVVC